MSRVALYARVSSEIQEKEATIESQVAQLRETAEIQGDTVVQEYRDDGFSGDLLARPGLDRLRDDAGKGLFDRVIVLSPDRLARRWVYGEVIADELRRQNVTIQYLNQKDDGTEEGKLLLGITGLFAQYEKAKIIERTRRGRLFSARSGNIVTSKAPYGYNYIPRSPERRGLFQVNDEEAQVVRLIFQLFANQQMSISSLMRELLRRGIRSVMGRSVWERSMVTKILRNTTYIGVWHYNKMVAAEPRRIRKPDRVRRRLNTSEHVRSRDQWVAVPGIPPIVEAEIFERAQRQLQRNRQFCNRRRKREYLLAGLCRCGSCGRAMAGGPNNGYLYYRCTANSKYGGLVPKCRGKAAPVPKLDQAVWNAIKSAINNPCLIRENSQAIQRHHASSYADLLRERHEITGRLKKIETGQERLLEAYTAGAITLQQLSSQMEKAQSERDALNARLSQTETQTSDQPIDESAIETYCNQVAKGLDVLEGDFLLRQKFIRSVLDSVKVFAGSVTITGALPITSAEPQENYQSASPSLQQRGGKPTIRFELAAAL